ncbi:MAG: hypothetical protein KJO45_07075 [Sulfurovum sp.]|nr:hypothetical protein [Sulfurovum sp.]
MKKIWYLFSILFLISMIFVWVDWNTDGFNFFEFQEQHFYFQSWISIAGILFATIMAITTVIMYKKTKHPSLRYISIGFLLMAIVYSIIGYHASYCEVCSDLGYCAASHSYPNYLIIIILVIFVLRTIMVNHSLDVVKKAELLQKLSYGLISATIFLSLTLFISLKYLKIHDHISYLSTNNFQALIFILPLIAIVWAFVHFSRINKASGIYIFMTVLVSMSFLIQFFHILRCKDCHTMECSEFYVVSGLIMVIVLGLFIHAVNIQLLKHRE